MITTRNNRLRIEYKKLIGVVLVLAFFALIIAFSYNRFQSVWRGVPLTITSPEQGETIDRDLIDITGSAPRAVILSINGDTVFVEEAGDFRYPYPIHLGYNEVVIVAEDKFGNTSQENLYINGITNK